MTPIHTHEQRKLFLAGLRLLGMIDIIQAEIKCIEPWTSSIFFDPCKYELALEIRYKQLRKLIEMYESLTCRILYKPLPNSEKIVKSNL